MTPAAAPEPRLRFLADEDFNAGIVRGVLIREPSFDVVGVYDVGLGQAQDRDILEWAAREDRVVLTHDENTMTAQAYARLKADLPLPGVVVIRQSITVGVAIGELLLLLGAGTPDDVRNKVLFFPL